MFLGRVSAKKEDKSGHSENEFPGCSTRYRNGNAPPAHSQNRKKPYPGKEQQDSALFCKFLILFGRKHVFSVMSKILIMKVKQITERFLIDLPRLILVCNSRIDGNTVFREIGSDKLCVADRGSRENGPRVFQKTKGVGTWREIALEFQGLLLFKPDHIGSFFSVPNHQAMFLVLISIFIDRRLVRC